MGGVTRKELLVGAAAAGVAAGCGSSSTRPDPGDRRAVKAQFGLSRDVRHFDAFVLSSHPRAVRDAVERHRRGLDADPAGYLRRHEQELEARVAEAAAGYLAVDPLDLAFIDSTTMGLGLVYGRVDTRGPAVATEHDFYARHEALRLRFGPVRPIRLYGDPAQATVQGIVEAVRRGVDGAGVLALTWVHSSTGVKLPLPEIARAIERERRRGLLVVVDGVHGLGADDEPVRIESFDVFVAGCHKWLGGPRGTGLVWTIEGWGRLRPTIPTFDSTSYVAWLEDRPPPPDAPPGPTFGPGLPCVRAPLGARRGVRVPGPPGPQAGGRADPLARHAAQAGPRRDPARAARHADVRAAVGGHRLPRRAGRRGRARRSIGSPASTGSPRA
jgi:hypothetical protein